MFFRLGVIRRLCNRIESAKIIVLRNRNGILSGIPLWVWSDESIWSNIKFIVAFDMDYEYLE